VYREGKERLIFVTNNQCDISHLFRVEFADMIVDAWVRRSTKWVGISEAHEKGGIYVVYIVTSTWLKNCPQDKVGKLSESSRSVNAAFN
jgi:hypothetical protein